MFEKCGGDPTLRAWLVGGVTADLRFASGRPAQFLGHGLVRSPRLRLLVRGHGGLWALDQRARRQCPHCTRGGRLFRGCDLHSAAPRQAAIARLWHFVRRAARGLIRATASAARRPARARRHGVDRRRLADPCRTEKETSRVQSQEPAADRQGLHLFALRSRSSGALPKKKSSTPSPTRSLRWTVRCRPAPMSTCAAISRWWTLRKLPCRR